LEILEGEARPKKIPEGCQINPAGQGTGEGNRSSVKKNGESSSDMVNPWQGEEQIIFWGKKGEKGKGKVQGVATFRRINHTALKSTKGWERTNEGGGGKCKSRCSIVG